MSSPRLPRETLDHIIDFLYDEPGTLKECCLVSKPWVPRARKHLFAKVVFRSAKDLESWKKTFPDPLNSPSYHTHTLAINRTRAVMEADARVGGLIQTFSCVVRLTLWTLGTDKPLDLGNLEKIPLAPFHKFTSTLKSLHVGGLLLPCPQTFNLVRSFPLLEDLSLLGRNKLLGDGDDLHGPRIIISPTSPPFIRSLGLEIFGGMGDTVRYLLDLPNGPHFRQLSLLWHHEEDLRWTTKLVARCANTLKCLIVRCYPPCTSPLVPHWSYSLPLSSGDSSPVSIDLSKAIRLRAAVFRAESPTIIWITTALQTITSEHRYLQKITIHAPYCFSRIDANVDVSKIVGGTTYREWLDLDRLLAQLWESRSIRTKIRSTAQEIGKKQMSECMGYLLPEATERGIIDLVENDGFHGCDN